MKIVLIIFGLFFYFNFCTFSASDSLQRVVDVQSQKFKTLLETVLKNYYKDTVDLVKISEKAFSSLLQTLDDFSNYFSAEQYEKIKTAYKGASLGVGLQLFRRGDTLIVFNIIKGSPADSVGIQLGDRIIYINHEFFVGKDANTAFRKIIESKDKVAIITVKRGNVLLEFAVPVKEIELSSIVASYKIPQTQIGVLKLIRFSLSATKDFVKAFDSLIKAGSNTFVIDLRGNQGGYLDEVISLCSLFLSKGDTIVIVSGRNENQKVYLVEKDGKYLKYPLIILVDNSTASASEIFASSLQDNDRAIVLGERTFGKGLVQRTWEFNDGSAFRLTVGQYITPLGREIQKSEVKNVELEGFADLFLDSQHKEAIQNAIRQFGIKKQLPVFFTKKGRTLLGGGGVFPDYYLLSDTTPPYLKKLKTSGLVNDFILRFFLENSKNFNELKDLKFYYFLDKFEISEAIITEFKKYLDERKSYLDNFFQNELEQIKVELKATLAYALWGDMGYYSVQLRTDKILFKVKDFENLAKELVKN